MLKALNLIGSFWRRRDGLSSVEYALMTSLVAGGIVIAAMALGVAVAGEFDEATNCVTDSSACN